MFVKPLLSNGIAYNEAMMIATTAFCFVSQKLLNEEHVELLDYASTVDQILHVFNMNKTELVAAIAEQAGVSKKDAEKTLKAFTDVVADELKKGGKVQLVGFGTFEVSERAAREGRNPQTGKAMKIKASKAPKFKAGKALKDMLN